MSRELPAGRELDVLIAEKVMGWVVRTTAQIGVPGWREGDFYINKPDAAEPRWGHMLLLPPYSTDIRAAWDVVEKLQPANMTVNIDAIDGCGGQTWLVRFGEAICGSAETAPLAICRAALFAVGRLAPSPGDERKGT